RRFSSVFQTFFIFNRTLLYRGRDQRILWVKLRWNQYNKLSFHRKYKAKVCRFLEVTLHYIFGDNGIFGGHTKERAYCALYLMVFMG
ncbi:MAG: hypothetical protein WCI90_02890, partial [Chlorobium sp.]